MRMHVEVGKGSIEREKTRSHAIAVKKHVLEAEDAFLLIAIWETSFFFLMLPTLRTPPYGFKKRVPS